MDKTDMKSKMKKDREVWSIDGLFSRLFKKDNPPIKAGENTPDINPPDKDNCPTGILLYIATSRNCLRSMDPWYNRIKELSGDANFHFGEFHRAVIFGLCPELKQACEYFKELIDKEAGKKRKLTNEDLLEIENKAITKFGLPQSLSLSKIDEEQQKRINENKAAAMKEYVMKETKIFFPAVQVITQSLMKSLSLENKDGLEFIQHFGLINNCLLNEDAFNKKKSTLPSEVAEVVEQLFELRKNKVLSNDFKISKFNKFKDSSFVKDFSYKGNKMELNDNLSYRLSLLRMKRDISL